MAGNTSSTAIRTLLKEAINNIVQQPVTAGFGPTSVLMTADQARRPKDSASASVSSRAIQPQPKPLPELQCSYIADSTISTMVRGTSSTTICGTSSSAARITSRTTICGTNRSTAYVTSSLMKISSTAQSKEQAAQQQMAQSSNQRVMAQAAHRPMSDPQSKQLIGP